LVDKVNVVVAFPPLVGVTFVGEKEQIELAGSPEQENVMAELKPFRPPTVTVKDVA